MTADTEPVDTWIGYDKSHFLTNLGDALTDPTTIVQKEARFASAPTALDAGKLARWRSVRGDYKDAIAMYRKGEEIDPSVDYSFQVFDAMFTGFRKSDAFTSDEIRKAADATLAEKGRTPSEIVDVAFYMRSVGTKIGDRGYWLPYLPPALAASGGGETERLKSQHQELKIDYTLLIEKNEKKAIELKAASMPEGWKDDAAEINDFSWWCFENMVNLEEAEALARRGAELAPAGAERAMILDTAAEICNARGNCDDAVELIRRAIADDPQKQYYKDQLARFEKIRAQGTN